MAAIPELHSLLLDSLETENLRHGKRTLRDHLLGTAAILSDWEQPPDVVALGLFHSIYSTPVYRESAAGPGHRPAIQEILGEELESRLYTYSLLRMEDVVSSLKSSTGATVHCVPDRRRSQSEVAGPSEVFLPRSTAEDFLIVHIANVAEQDISLHGPGVYLHRCSEAAKLVAARAPRLSEVFFRSVGLHDEMHLRDLYNEALSCIDCDRERAFRLFVSANAILALPEIAACSAFAAEDPIVRVKLASDAREAFLERNLVWDKRLSKDEWISLCAALCSNDDSDRSSIFPGIIAKLSNPVPSAPIPERFFQYLNGISRSPASQSVHGWYPGLTSKPFHDPYAVSIASELERRFKEIRLEVQNLPENDFHSEAEPIGRVGRWEVLMLFEAGRRRAENCKRLPIITEILENSEEVRKSAGLVYLSRLKAGSRVAAHRGGTNSRLRLHFGIQVPEGDCAMRVDSMTRKWIEGKCLLFDDYYEHEVWNETDQDRLILLVDVWHTDLSVKERTCLDAINKQISRQASGRARYWENNRRQRLAENRDRASTDGPSARVLGAR